MTIDRAAWPFAIPIVAVALLAVWFLPVWTAVPFLPLLLFVLWFFRDPSRQTPADPDALISPADGRIIQVGPERISVFMNVFNVHVCRTPMQGAVASVTHHAGRFMAAFKDEATTCNERVVIQVDHGARTIQFTLVAGLIARRIVPRVQEGRTLAAGERIGLIRFGSRVDLALAQGIVPAVKIGDRVVAGESVLARWSEESSGKYSDGTA